MIIELHNVAAGGIANAVAVVQSRWSSGAARREGPARRPHARWALGSAGPAASPLPPSYRVLQHEYGTTQQR
jgi:hypothetical protein